MSYNFDYDYFEKKKGGIYNGFEDNEFDYEFSDELMYEGNRYVGEYGDYEEYDN